VSENHLFKQKKKGCRAPAVSVAVTILAAIFARFRQKNFRRFSRVFGEKIGVSIGKPML
jgi:hypothetical protein